MELTKQMKQMGEITFGPDIVARYWIEQAKAEGYTVLICPNYAELYK